MPPQYKPTHERLRALMLAIQTQIIHTATKTTWNETDKRLWLTLADTSYEADESTFVLPDDYVPTSKLTLRAEVDMELSVLPVAIIFGKYELFTQLYPRCYKRERRFLCRLVQDQSCSWKKSSIWNMVMRKLKYLRRLKPLRQQTSTLFFSVFLKIMALLKGLPNKNVVKVMTDFMNSAQFADPVKDYRKFTDQWVSLLRKVRERPSRKAVYMLPLSLKFINRLPTTAAVDIFPGEPLRQRAFMSKVWECFEYTSDQNPMLIERWVRSNFESFHRFLNHRIGRFMTSLYCRSLKLHPAPVYTHANQDGVYLLHHSQMNVEIFENHCSVEFKLCRNSQNQLCRAVVSKAYWEKHDQTSDTDLRWVFFRNGIRISPDTHPWLQQHLQKFNGRVPRLKFQFRLDDGRRGDNVVRVSDGLLLPYSEVKTWMLDLSDTTFSPLVESPSGTDITDSFNVWIKPRRKKKKPLLPLEASHWNVTFPLRRFTCLQPHHLSMLAPDYAIHFSPQQKLLLHSILWDFPGLNLPMPEESHRITHFVVQVLDRLTQPWPKAVGSYDPWSLLVRTNEHTNSYDTLNPTLFWNIFELYQPLFPPAAQACYSLVHKGQTNAFNCVVQNSHRFDVLTELFRICSRIKDLSFLVAPHNSTINLLRTLFTEAMPSGMKRLAWQSLLIKGSVELFNSPRVSLIRCSVTPPWPNLPISITVMPPLERGTETLVFDRHTGLIENSNRLLNLINPLDVNIPHQFDLQVKNEPGIGRSIYSDILYQLWRKMIEKHVIVLYEMDTKDSNDRDALKSGFCINQRLQDVYTIGEPHRGWLFSLGFVSGFCVAKGLHLPFRLHLGFWRYLYLPENMENCTMDQIFQERHAYGMNLLKAMDSETLKTTLGLGDAEVDFQTREDLVTSQFLPNLMDLEAFKAGWTVFTNNLSLWNMVHQLNDLFCEPPAAAITHQGFMSTFQKDSHAAEIFLEYVQGLTQDRLCHLVSFITGKKRLPLLVLGEEIMRVSFTGVTGTLPVAQNCTHMLIMPAPPVSFVHRQAFLQSIATSMETVFRFNTVYGFA